MQSVRTPALSGGALATLVVAALLALGAGIAVSQLADGGASTSSARSAPPKLALLGGLPLQQARCEQWLGASDAERARAVTALQQIVGGPTTWGPATALSTSEAQTLFQRTCANDYARYFLLYELYTRAAGFHSLAAGRTGT